VVLSATICVFSSAGWAVALGWIVLAFVVGVLGWLIPRPDWGRPDAADFAMVLGWATALAARPQLVDLEHGGWLAPLLMMAAARRLSASVVPARSPDFREPGPPTRDVRGTLSLRKVVAADPEGLARTVPLDLELRAGDSLAVLCDAGADRRALAEVLSGRRSPVDGEVVVDGVPIKPADRLVAVVAPGERFVPGGVELNVGALSIDELDGGSFTAVSEACSLSEVADMLGDGSVTADGRPLDVYHRLLLLAARVIPSSYRLLVVVDPMPWVNAVRGEIWRSAIVRASVGRTSIWITGDRDLASRATQIMEFKQGALRPYEQSDQ
jgi:ABC-type transport system involved in cytochrome bd biosynthesis fused ATPase/permease subunit